MVLCWGEAARGEKNLQLGYGVSGRGVARGGTSVQSRVYASGFAATVFIVTRRTINVPTSIDVDQLVAEEAAELRR